MVASNQTRIGFTQQKPGSRRQLHSKNSKDVLPEVNTTKSPAPVEPVLEIPATAVKTMEEKLAEYKKQKAEKAAQKVQQPVITQLNRTRSSTRLSTRSATITQYLTPKAPGSKEESITSDNEQTIIATAQKTDNQVIISDSEDMSLQTQVEIIKPTSETTVDVQSSDTKQAVSEPLSYTSKSRKSPVDDVDQGITNGSKDEADDADIHPLARLVAKASPRTSIGKIQVEESGNSNQRTSDHKPISTPTKLSSRIISSDLNAQKPLLTLPSHMDVLFTNFKAFENVFGFTKRQGQLCFYHKMKKHIELQSSRNFEIKHLAQFKTLLPEVYKFVAAPCLFEGTKTRSILIEMEELKDENDNGFAPQEEKRRNLFTKRMNEHIKQHHEKFLTSTNPPRTDTYPHYWHPEFDLESVTPIEEAEIPLLPPPVVNILDINLKDLGNKRDLLQRKPKDELPASLPAVEKGKSTVTSEEYAKVAPNTPGVKALSALEQLKERIRLKQLERKEADQKILSPEAKRQALISSRLPAVFDLIRFKRVDVISLKALTDQVVKSSRMPISVADGKESLEMLAKAIPEWCSVFSLDDGVQYFKVLRDDDKGAKIVHDEKALRARLVAKTINNP
ncbi:hypothetical protein BGZ76_009516 [Entomortierella beljakovae]|nr:hypothetical protein BGZ76_009516 [Entomortierella beljakovae]